MREHDYAVLDLKREGDSRLLLIKNPWCDSMVWTGVGSSATLKVHIVGETPDNTSNKFWMAFEDVLQHFDSLYVNWNPALFAHRQDHHFTWEMPDPTEEHVFTKNPQFSVLSPSQSPVWVLLNRHWQDGELDILRERKAAKDHRHNTAQTLAYVSKQLGFMSLSLFATSPPGTRVPLPESQRCLLQGPYVDSPNTLLRYKPTPNIPQTLVIAQGELPLPEYSFSLSFFSSDPLTISPAPDPLPHSQTIAGSWARRTAGGSAVHPTYSLNPAYSLIIPSPMSLSLLLSTPHRDLPIHISILFTSGRQPSVSGRDILASSPEYQRGCTFLSLPHIDTGKYTIVLSTFEPGQLSNFSLRICSSLPTVKVSPVPPEAAGKLRTALPIARFAGQVKRLRAPAHVSRLVKLSALARSGMGSGPPVTLRVGLELGTGPHRTVLTVSREGEFADASLGLRAEEVDVDPESVRRGGGLWVVLEQIGGEGGGGVAERGGGGSSGGGEGGVQVEVLSDGVVNLGAWECADDG